MDDKKEKQCHCHEHGDDEKCSCGENCTCGDNYTCGDECHCNDECCCNDEHCNDECHCQECACNEDAPPENCNCVTDESVLAEQYLNLAKQVQADFENFRRHAIEDIKSAKLDGQMSVIEVFLPCLDTFREAKKSINDEAVRKGVEMIEEKIMEALKSLGVEKIPAIGEKYNPHLHEAIMAMKDENKENDIILEEYQGGYTFKDKVVRHSKVIVNKKED